ncbi:RHS repeat-associated core domain-containing protein [Chitinophaga japonensis]|uniref:RHS repeat-associated protein n=1 Tax=Chitinophaga japonensis TaxID=104662 RepID=A0A562SZA6_CHIJA|nr:RHS repeat-associated core domain-containing protein [Chitinophaga japonensis]TWI86592.1 RHS repeat-associated protein [Chitinophaga japonensis]
MKATPDELQTLAVDKIPVAKSGFLYVYTSNETQQDVFFDNVVVNTIQGPLLEETHYYPFGLTMNGISSNALKGVNYPENRKKYNGIEHTTDLDLNQYDAFYRNLDPQIGRWWQVDPKPTDWESPYIAMSNNPIRYKDFLGDTSTLPKYVSAPANAVGSTAKGALFGLNGRYQLEPVRGATVTGLRDTQLGRISKTTGKAVGEWAVRVDNPHGGAPTPHLNINPKVTGVPDPHTPISAGTLKTLGTAGQVMEGVGKVAKPVAVVTDVLQVGIAIKTDIQEGKSGDNTIVAGGRVAGSWGGALTGAAIGAKGGAFIGSFAGPAGTAVGGFVGGLGGGIIGGILGSMGGETVGEKIVELKNE